MRTLPVLLLSTFLAGTALAAERSSHVYKPAQNRLGEPRPLKLHVFSPPDLVPSEPRPGIVFFFGGGWKSGDPRQFATHCEYLASRGMVAITADYRTREVNQTTPREALMDAKSAIRWIRQNAALLGIDPDRLAAGGVSAGGHMAAATGTTKGFEEAGEDLKVSSRPNALILLAPVFDNGPDGFAHEHVKEYWEAFSPIHNIEAGAPPTAVFLGTKDKHIPVATAERYKALMEQVGSRCDLYLYPEQPHGCFAPTSKLYKDYLEKIDRFLTSLGYLQGEPTITLETAEGAVE